MHVSISRSSQKNAISDIILMFRRQIFKCTNQIQIVYDPYFPHQNQYHHHTCHDQPHQWLQPSCGRLNLHTQDSSTGRGFRNAIPVGGGVSSFEICLRSGFWNAKFKICMSGICLKSIFGFQSAHRKRTLGYYLNKKQHISSLDVPKCKTWKCVSKVFCWYLRHVLWNTNK